MSERKPRIVGIIPARLNSERLPGKVLRNLAGRPMLQHVYDGARGCALLDSLLVAADSEAVRDYCVAHRIPVLMTSPAHRSGTERLHEVIGKIPAASSDRVGVGQARVKVRMCVGDVTHMRFRTMRGCLESKHDQLIRELNVDYWHSQTGS